MVDCPACDNEKTIWCPAGEDCDSGYVVDADGDLTKERCPVCKGKGEIRCPKC